MYNIIIVQCVRIRIRVPGTLYRNHTAAAVPTTNIYIPTCSSTRCCYVYRYYYYNHAIAECGSRRFSGRLPSRMIRKCFFSFPYDRSISMYIPTAAGRFFYHHSLVTRSLLTSRIRDFWARHG